MWLVERDFSVRHLLVARSSLCLRLKLLERVVVATMKWVLGTVFPTQAILRPKSSVSGRCLAFTVAGTSCGWTLSVERVARLG